MKKMMLLAALVLGATNAWAGRDRFGSEREDVALTSFTKTQESVPVVMNTVASVLYGVNVTSPVTGSWVNFLSTGNPVPTSSTRTEVHTNTWGWSGGKPKYFPQGISYIKNGNAAIEILFDFVGTSVSARYQ